MGAMISRSTGPVNFSSHRAPAFDVARAFCIATLFFAAAAQAKDIDALLEGPLEPLKAAYLRCNEEALQRLLGLGEAAECSMIYEAVKRRVFDGDFERLIAWSRAASADRSLVKASR